MRAVDEP
jgi:hypothetical protein